MAYAAAKLSQLQNGTSALSGEDKIVRPAEAKFSELLERRTKRLRVESV